MNRLLKNILYKMTYQFGWAAWYLAYYALAMILVYIFFFKFSVISSESGGYIYRLWGSVIFQFAVTMRFKEDFDYFLVLGNTRNEIFKSLVGVAIGFSIFFSFLITMERVVVDYLNTASGYQNFNDGIHYFSPYTTVSPWMTFVFFLIVCTCCSVFSILAGSLFYRYGKKFTMAFWLLFGSIPTIFLPLSLLSNNLRGKIADTMQHWGRSLMDFNVVSSSGVFLIITLIFAASAYFNILKLDQK